MGPEGRFCEQGAGVHGFERGDQGGAGRARRARNLFSVRGVGLSGVRGGLSDPVTGRGVRRLRPVRGASAAGAALILGGSFGIDLTGRRSGVLGALACCCCWFFCWF
ncbi:hypothetical protein GCM10017784_32000 [Deinococcus indicus]|nr:hypothetical protein GCM10017784_32000 [Deinococcus indicus]